MSRGSGGKGLINMVFIQTGKRLGLLAAVVVAVCSVALFSSQAPPAGAPGQPPPEPIFVPVKIDGPVHDPARSTLLVRAVQRVRLGGRLQRRRQAGHRRRPELVPGARLGQERENFRDGAETNGPETDDNSEFAMDVNRDGRPDIVSSGWMRMKGVTGTRTPARAGREVEAHRIHSARTWKE